MNVNMNVGNYATAQKNDTTSATNKSDDFKSILNNQELISKNLSNDNIQKKSNSDQNEDKVNKENLDKTNNKKQQDDIKNKDTEKTTLVDNTSVDLNKPEDDVDSKTKIIKLIETAIEKLKKSAEGSSSEVKGAGNKDQMAELEQLLQLLSSMIQNVPKVTQTTKGGATSDSINLGSIPSGEQLKGVKQITTDANNVLNSSLSEIVTLLQKAKGNETATTLNQENQPNSISLKAGMLKSNLSELVALLEKAKANNNEPSQITNVLQKLTTLVDDLKEDLSLLKVPSVQAFNGNSQDKSIKDTLLQKVMEISANNPSENLIKNQMQSSSDSQKGNKSSGNSSTEEKFLNNLLGGDKDEKISKAVNFMNQFETVKTADTSKLQAVNLVVDKSNFAVDIIKNVKFMEVNNLKDLTVKMNPKELGEITIKLTMESGIMKASISAQNKDTYNLLNQNIQDISDKLKNMDIKIQNLDINVYEDSTFFNKNSNEKNNSGKQNNNSKANMGVEEEVIPINNNYVLQENQVNKFV